MIVERENCLDRLDRKRSSILSCASMENSSRNTTSALGASALELLESMPLMAYAADRVGRVTQVNRRWREYTGSDSSDSLGLSGTDAIHPDDLPAVIEAWGRAVGTLRPYQLEYRLRRFDGIYRWHVGRAEPVYDEDGVVSGWIGTATDVHDLGMHNLVKSESRRGLDGLRRSEERLELGIQVAGFALAEVDYALGTIHFSPDAAALYGLGEHEVTISRERSHETFHPDDRAALEQVIAQCLDPDGPGWFERDHRVVHPNGEVRWLGVRKQVFFDRTNQPHRPYRALLAAQDITERKVREANLAFLSVTQGVLAALSDADEIARAAGSRLGEYMGLAHCLFVEMNEFTVEASVFHDHHTSNSRSMVGRYHLEQFHTADELGLLASGQVVTIGDTGVSRQGTAAFKALGIGALATAPHLNAGRWRFALSAQFSQAHAWRSDEIGLLRDFASSVYLRLERARAEAALREREERFHTLFDSIDEGFCICEMILDQDGQPCDYRFLEVNGIFENQTGLRGAVGRTALELVPGLEAHWIELYGRVALTGEPARFEQGSAAIGRWFDVYACRVGKDNSLRFAVVFKDVSERRRAEENLRAVYEAQRRFVSDASHELRAPLTAIQGNLELLHRHPQMSAEDRAESLHDAWAEAGRMVRLVNDLLAAARGEGRELRHRPIALEEVLGAAWRGAQALSEDRQFELGGLVPAGVLGDPDAIKQLALILLENAVKYTPDGGTVRLQVSTLGGWAEFRVSDSGIGIAAEDVPHVFERFYRADPSRSRGSDPGGSGLGLTIARRIVEDHGGDIRLESELGRGTVFTVRLPLVPESEI
jgi:PAS domain S-box-containing protein